MNSKEYFNSNIQRRCCKCDKNFSQIHLVENKKNKQEKLFKVKCENCGSQKFACPLCDSTFEKNSVVKEHIKNIHRNVAFDIEGNQFFHYKVNFNKYTSFEEFYKYLVETVSVSSGVKEIAKFSNRTNKKLRPNSNVPGSYQNCFTITGNALFKVEKGVWVDTVPPASSGGLDNEQVDEGGANDHLHSLFEISGAEEIEIKRNYEKVNNELQVVKKPFKETSELISYILIKFFGVTTKAYTFLSITSKDNLYPSYSTIQRRMNELEIQKPSTPEILKEHIVYYSILESIQEICKDENTFKKLHFRYEEAIDIKHPYQTRCFKEVTQELDSQIFPILLFMYYDEFSKNRTKNASTGGMYFTLFNFGCEEINCIDNINIIGFSKSKIEYWELMQCFVDEIVELNGKKISINRYDGEQISIQIFLIGMCLDTPQRMETLGLMKGECSRCLDVYGNCFKTSDILSGVENVEENENILKVEYRNLEEMKEMYDKVHTIKPNQRRKQGNGIKIVFKEEIQMKRNGLDSQSINKKLSKLKNKEKHENPVYELRFFNPFRTCVVDYFHLVAQGLANTLLMNTLDYLYYGSVTSDFENLMAKHKTASGIRTSFKVNELEGKNMFDFLSESMVILYKFIFNSDRVEIMEVSNEEKMNLYNCWFYLNELNFNSLSDTINEKVLEKITDAIIKFKKYFKLTFGKENSEFPNFHWADHLVEDISYYGSPKFFWAMIFELKHSVFKSFNDSSNNKNVEENGAKSQMEKKKILCDYPELRELIKNESLKNISKLKKENYVLVKNETMFVGKVIETDPIAIDDIYYLDGIDNKTKLTKLEKYDLDLPHYQIIGRCNIYCLDNSYYLNHFCFHNSYFKFKK
jgi:hypothetical protein